MEPLAQAVNAHYLRRNRDGGYLRGAMTVGGNSGRCNSKGAGSECGTSGGVGEVGNGRCRRFHARLACAAHRNGGFLNAGLFKLEAGDALRTGGRLGLGEGFQGFPDAFVIALTMILTAEIFVEEPSPRA